MTDIREAAFGYVFPIVKARNHNLRFTLPAAIQNGGLIARNGGTRLVKGGRIAVSCRGIQRGQCPYLHTTLKSKV